MLMGIGDARHEIPSRILLLQLADRGKKLAPASKREKTDRIKLLECKKENVDQKEFAFCTQHNC